MKKAIVFIYHLSIVGCGLLVVIGYLSDFFGYSFLKKITIIPVGKPIVLWWFVAGTLLLVFFITYILKKKYIDVE